ncbi:hypothetical protein [Verrucosispora sp. TAA-831]|uniref:hypothetical protein n=1 Tax=Verrucosispora sp. TAA-831 TaxID=3422227 RepID=UPI003D6EA5B6
MVPSAVRPPRATARPLPWAEWQQLAGAHPTLLTTSSEPPHRQPADAEEEDGSEEEQDYLIPTGAVWLASMVWLGLGLAYNNVVLLAVGCVLAAVMARR